jgi:glycosyltransferase 2 family protein
VPAAAIAEKPLALIRVKIRPLIIAALGLVLALYSFIHVGFGAVFSAAGAVGWGGFAILCLYSLGLFVPLAEAWNVLLAGSSLSRLIVFVWARMVRDAASELLPFSQLGGIYLGARTAIQQGILQPQVCASTIVDVTAEMAAQILFIAIGVAMLSVRVPRSPISVSITTIVISGLALALIVSAILILLQRYGHLIVKLMTERLPGLVLSAAAVTSELNLLCRSKNRLGMSVTLHFLAWIGSAIGAWIAFRLIGARVDFMTVLAIESLVCAARSTAVFIPNALGVQEAAYALLCPLFGVGAEVGLAVSLLKRARDLLIGVPTLLIWQVSEGRQALGSTQRS